MNQISHILDVYSCLWSAVTVVDDAQSWQYTFIFYTLLLGQWEVKPVGRPHVYQQTQPYELHKTKHYRRYSTYANI